MAKSPFAGGNWGDHAKHKAAAEPQVAVPAGQGSGGNAKTVEVAPTTEKHTEKLELKQPASVETAPTPAKRSEEPVATIDNKTSETPKEQPIGKRTIEVSKDDLVVIPGYKGMTAEQIAWELDKSRNIDKRFTELERRSRSVEETPKPEPKKPEKFERPELRPRPTFKPPKGFVEGDEEYDNAKAEYDADITAWTLEKQGLRPILEPLFDKLEALESRFSQQDQQQAEQSQNLDRNRANYTAALQELPFEMQGLEADTAQAVFDRIRDVGREIYGVDLGDSTQMRSKEHSVDLMSRMVLRAFPPGARPPGYEEPVPSDALLEVQRNGGRPLVEKTQPDPLPEPGPAGLAYTGAGEKEKGTGPVDFSKKVSSWMNPRR